MKNELALMFSTAFVVVILVGFLIGCWAKVRTLKIGKEKMNSTKQEILIGKIGLIALIVLALLIALNS